MKKILILFCICACSTGLRAASTEAVTAEYIMDMVESAEKEIKTLRLEYTQEIVVSYANEVQKSSGRAFFLKPEKIRIEIEKPYREIFITDGDTVWFHNLDFNQVMRGKWSQLEKSGKSVSMNLPKNLFNLGGSMASLKKSCNVSYAGVKDDFYVLNLSPKEGSGYVISLFISMQDFFPVKTSLITNSVQAHTTVVNYEKNAEIDKKIFRFKKPAGAEVMDIPF